MIITQPVLDALRTTLSLQYQTAFESAETYSDKLCTPIPSNSKSNTYGWAERIPTMREWIGPRVAQNISEKANVLYNKTWELTVEIPREDIEDDNLGILTNVTMPELGRQAKQHPDVLLTSLIQGNVVAYDGLPLFSASHTLGSFGYVNDYTTKPLNPTNFSEVWSGMSSIKGEDGRPLKINPALLIVPPQLKAAAMQLLNAEFAPSINSTTTVTASNVFQGWAEVLVVPDLANEPARWYLADVSKGIKPFVHQLRRPAAFVSRDRLDDPKVFDARTFTYGVDLRDNIGPTLPFLIARATA